MFQFVKTYFFGAAELNFSHLENGRMVGRYTLGDFCHAIELPLRRDETGREYVVLYGEKIPA